MSALTTESAARMDMASRDTVTAQAAQLISRAVIYDVDDDSELEWQDAALCAQADPEVWFPEKGGSTLAPKRVCARCPVRAPCLAFALERKDHYGVYGGLSERERRRLENRFGDDITAAVASVIPSAQPQPVPHPQENAA